MNNPSIDQQFPIYKIGQDDIPGDKIFRIARAEGATTYKADLLVPHRKDFYLLVYVKRGSSRHWVDMKPYVLKNNTFYFATPSQIQVKEDPQPMWGTSISFTTEFLALQENAALGRLPLIQNPHNGHELALSQPDILFVEDMLDRLYAEFNTPGEWQQRILTAGLTMLLTHLSRLYTWQFQTSQPSPGNTLLKNFQARIEENFRELHEVGDYASLLNISAGHLSEVIKSQSSKPAITHIHARLVLEAKRMLFHTQQPLKEIAYDLGFADASYFNRFFKRETGQTPAEYRTATRKMYH